MQQTEKLIFIVDDDRFHLEVMQQIIKSISLDRIVCFENGSDCLDQIHSNPAIVFLDHQMDEYSGFEILKKIKRYNPNIYVVMVSAQDQIQTAVETMKYGAFDYLKKDEKLEVNIEGVLMRINEMNTLLAPVQKRFSLKYLIKQ